MNLDDPEVFLTRLEMLEPGRDLIVRVAPAESESADGLRVSPLSGKTYAHYELVAFTGPPEQPEFSWIHLEHPEADLTFSHTKSKVRGRLGCRRTRTLLAPTWSQRVAPGDGNYPADLNLEREAGENDSVLLVEYGLAPDTDYFARVATESYMLRPELPGEPPRKREKKVLQLSDAPIVANRDSRASPLTPLYRGWSY